MRRVVMLAAAAVLAAVPVGAGAQDARQSCCERGVPRPWAGYDRGVRWVVPAKDAFALAAKERKPLLVFHLVGDLDKEGC